MKSRSRPATLTIGELAERFGLATHVLRHWESVGLLTPARTDSGRRRYRPVDLYRVAAILQAKEAGLTLTDIHAMFSTTDPSARTAILRRERDNLAHRIAEAQTSLSLIDAALRCRHGDVATCPHFQALLADRAGAGER